jgi:hypothetical protein
MIRKFSNRLRISLVSRSPAIRRSNVGFDIDGDEAPKSQGVSGFPQQDKGGSASPGFPETPPDAKGAASIRLKGLGVGAHAHIGWSFGEVQHFGGNSCGAREARRV